jgi:putative ABC transport system permease protein
MNFLATLRIALAALRINKLRSALTMLGIIIGVAAVITMVAVGAGAQARVEDQIKSLGSNLIIILSGNFTSGGVRMGSGSVTITGTAYALQRSVRRPRRAPQPRGPARSSTATTTGRRRSAASPPSTSRPGNGRLPRGRHRPTHVDGATRRAAGQTVARTLFGDSDPVGRPSASAASRTVIGVSTEGQA